MGDIFRPFSGLSCLCSWTLVDWRVVSTLHEALGFRSHACLFLLCDLEHGRQSLWGPGFPHLHQQYSFGTCFLGLDVVVYVEGKPSQPKAGLRVFSTARSLTLWQVEACHVVLRLNKRWSQQSCALMESLSTCLLTWYFKQGGMCHWLVCHSERFVCQGG